MIDDVRLAYAALATHEPENRDGLKTVPMPEVGGAFIGLDESARQHLLLAVRSDVELNPEVTTLSAETHLVDIGGKELWVLDITCLFASLSEVFDHFVAAVLTRMATTSDGPVGAVSHVLGIWRSFLAPPTRPPGVAKIASTLGELLMVRDVVTTSGRSDIAFWCGPFGQRHDLRSEALAIEVKTTRSHTGMRVTIHGEDQMVAPEGGALYLHFVRLEVVDKAPLRLTTIVDELLGLGVAAEQLFSALGASGIPMADLPATDSTGFEVLERFTLKVDDATPRIVPASFLEGKKPEGVVDLTYVIDLSGGGNEILSDNEYRGMLMSFGGAS